VKKRDVKQKPLLVLISQRREEVNLQLGSEFDKFKPWFKSLIFKCISWLNGSFLGGDGWGFLHEEVKIYLLALKSPLN
jgi:hypothetical protein